jgi:hypothetical protein
VAQANTGPIIDVFVLDSMIFLARLRLSVLQGINIRNALEFVQDIGVMLSYESLLFESWLSC